MSKSRVCLIVAHWFPPSSESGAQRPYRFFRYLPDHRYDTVVVCRGDAGAANIVDRTGQTSAAVMPGQAVVFGSRLIQRRVLPYNEQIEWATYAAAAASEIVRKREVSVVLSTAPPFGTHLAALWLKRKFGLRWVADFRDPLVGNPFRNRRWTNRYDAWLERLIMRNADAVIAVTDVIAGEWQKRYPQYAQKIHVIWNGFDPEKNLGPLPIPQRPYRVLAHVGSIYGGRHPLAVLTSLVRLVKRNTIAPPQIRVRFVGTIESKFLVVDRYPMKELIEWGYLQIEDRQIPRCEAVRITSTSDYLLLLDGNELDKPYTVPAKLFEYINVGRPILAVTNHGSPTERILAGSGVAATCIYPTETEDQIDRKIADFFDSTSRPHVPSRWFLENFDGERQTAQLGRILEELPLNSVSGLQSLKIAKQPVDGAR